MAAFLSLIAGFTFSPQPPVPGGNDCGVEALFVALAMLDETAAGSYRQLFERLNPRRDGNTIAELEAAARELGFHSLPVATSLDALRERKRPFTFVAHLNHDHFVVVRDCDEENVHVINGDRLALVPRRVFESTWSRHGLLLAKTVLEPESKVSGRVWWRSFWVWLGRCSIAVSAVFMVGALTIRRLRRIGLFFKSV